MTQTSHPRQASKPSTDERGQCSTGRGSFRHDIQGLRTIAVLMVVVYHSGLPAPGGFTGVDVFFVISGFVITSMLRRERDLTGRIGFFSFYVRRIKRLTPALALVVASTLVASAFLLSPLGVQQNTASTALGALFFTANIVIQRTTGGYFDAEASTNPLLNTWSLAVEEQFYLGFPLLLAISWLIAQRSGRHKTPLLIVTGVAIGSFILALLGSSGAIGADHVLLRWVLGFYSPVPRVWEFAVGSLLALSNLSNRIPTGTAKWLGTSGLVLVVFALFAINDQTPFPGLWTLVPVGGTLLLIVAGSAHPRNPISAALSGPAMVKIGDWSYSIYLWHWPCIVMAEYAFPDQGLAKPLAALLSFIPSVLSYRYLEEPVRTLRITSYRRLFTLISISLTPALVGAIALAWVATSGFGLPVVKSYQRDIQTPHADRLRGCDKASVDRDRINRLCLWNGEASGAPIYLLGDSHAGHLSDGVIRAGHELNRPTIVSTTNACPFMDAYLYDNQSPQAGRSWNTRCRDYNEQALRYLANTQPGVVIISNTDAYWTSDRFSIGSTPSALTQDSAAKLAQVDELLIHTVSSLEKLGHKVVLVQEVPAWTGDDAWDPAYCSVDRIINQSCLREMPRVKALERQGAVRQQVEITERQTSASILDFWDTFCPNQTCTMRGTDFLRYRDAGHLTVRQSIELAPQIKSVIATRP